MSGLDTHLALSGPVSRANESRTNQIGGTLRQGRRRQPPEQDGSSSRDQPFVCSGHARRVPDGRYSRHGDASWACHWRDGCGDVTVASRFISFHRRRPLTCLVVMAAAVSCFLRERRLSSRHELREHWCDFPMFVRRQRLITSNTRRSLANTICGDITNNKKIVLTRVVEFFFVIRVVRFHP